VDLTVAEVTDEERATESPEVRGCHGESPRSVEVVATRHPRHERPIGIERVDEPPAFPDDLVLRIRVLLGEGDVDPGADCLNPERRVYASSQQPTSEVSIRRRLNEDLYLNFASMSQTDANKAIIQAYVFPLVSWIWRRLRSRLAAMLCA
jgi:hypothetical protein